MEVVIYDLRKLSTHCNRFFSIFHVRSEIFTNLDDSKRLTTVTIVDKLQNLNQRIAVCIYFNFQF